MWGIGIVIGELFLYFMVRVVCFLGVELDDEEYQEFEEMLEYVEFV